MYLYLPCYFTYVIVICKIYLVFHCVFVGLKQTSESVEILGNSLTSPSSVEVITLNSTESRRHSQQTDEFVSPLESPWSEDKSRCVFTLLYNVILISLFSVQSKKYLLTVLKLYKKI